MISLPTLSEEKIKKIEGLVMAGKSVKEIAKELGISLPTAMKYAKLFKERQRLQGQLREERGGNEDEALKRDMRMMMEMMKEKIDPKAPIMAKWVSDVAWWFPLVLDFSKAVLPDVLRTLSENEIDIKNPEITARNAAAKVRALIKLSEERTKELEELEAKLKEQEARIKDLEGLIQEYEKLLKDYEEGVRELGKVIESLKEKASKTIAFLVKYLPLSLCEEDKARYFYALAPKLREVWGVEL